MNVPLSSSKARLVLWCGSLILAALLSFFSLRNAWAEHVAASQALPGLEAAARLEPGNARNWYLLGHYWQYNLDQRDTARAIVSYQKALALDPRSAPAWLDLGESYESVGELQSARDAFVRARDAYPISAEVAWRYGNFLLRQGELSAAFREIRLSLTAEPGRAPEAVSLCWRAAPEINAILDKALPASREVYLSALNVLVGQRETDASLAVWERLVSLQPKLQLGDAAAFLDALLAKRQIVEARKVWTQALALSGTSRPDDSADSLIWDGDFETDVNVGFAWRFTPARGAQISFDDQVKHSGNRALRVHFDGTQNASFSNVCQFVAVAPGSSYRFSAWMRTEALTTDRGIFFQAATPESPAAIAGMTPELRGTEQWSPVTLPLTVGKGIHLLQICLVRMPSQKLDNKIAGTVWVDSVSLTLEAPSSPAGRPARRAAPVKKDQR
jgi:hypothetical protein